MQKKTLSFLAVVFLVQVVFPGDLPGPDERKLPIRPWLLSISI